MAFVSQELKAKVSGLIKPILSKYGIKGTLSVYNSSTLVLKISSGKINFIKNYNETPYPYAKVKDRWSEDGYMQVNEYYIHENFSGIARDCLQELKTAMLVDHWDKSDSMTDFFHCAYYISINIGKWNKPYKLI